MRKKIVFIGAGSVSFTRNLVRDILTYPAFQDCELALVDIDEGNLALAKQLCDAIVQAGHYPALITATTNRCEALEGADGVLTTIQVGGEEAETMDVAIPKEYGISLAVGDTRGPSAIFRFLRSLPEMLAILRDIEKYCPNAIFLNYTNPMAMLCRALQSSTKAVQLTGLCHSVQQTVEMLSDWIGAPTEEMTYLCAGINHQAHYLKLLWNGQDAYPLLHEAITTRPEVYHEERVRNEMYLHLGYYPTESSGHHSEYNPWFRKRPDLLEEYCLQYARNQDLYKKFGPLRDGHWNPGDDRMERLARIEQERPGYNRSVRRQEEFDQWIHGPIDLKRGREYAACIFNAIFGDQTPYEFNGNVRNFGLIDNLPEGCCVEVPVLASKNGLESIHVGALPPQLALLNSISAQCEELAVQGALEGDREKIMHACMFDPLTSAVLSLGEIREMVDKMFAAEAPWLESYHF